MFRKDRIVRFIVSLSFCVLFGGCSISGPQVVRRERQNYNVAIQQTNAEQMLLNLVRLRYRDTPYFLELVSISSSFDIGGSGTASLTLPESTGDIYGLSTSVHYTEEPTITYTPLQGDKFVKQLMSPVDPDRLLLLYYSGWSIERVFRITLQNMNGLWNAPSASGPTPTYKPIYEEFAEVSRLLRAMQKERSISLGQSQPPGSDTPYVSLHFSQAAANCAEGKRLYELLHLDPEIRTFLLIPGLGQAAGNRIHIATRSYLGCLFYVSQSVEVSAEDEERGLVTVSFDPSGHRVDWYNVVGKLIRVHSCSTEPRTAYARIRYRRRWFYIDDADLDSKSTFSMLMQLFALQAGDIRSSGPVLTLPVR